MTPVTFETEIRKQLALMLKLRTHPIGFKARFRGAEDLLLERGIAYTAGPPPCAVYPRTCFQRSYQLATRRNSPWVYVEGFAIPAATGFAVEHAWLTRDDAPGVAFDVAWESELTTQYLGIPFKADYVRKIHRASKHTLYGVINAYWCRWPLLTGKHRIEEVTQVPTVTPPDHPGGRLRSAKTPARSSRKSVR